MIAIYKISTLKLVTTASNETEALQSLQKNQSMKVSAQVKSTNLHPQERQCIQTDQGCWFCKTDDFDLMYLVLAANTYPKRHAYALIQLLKEEFAKLANLKIHIKAPLKELCIRYNDLVQVDNIFLGQVQVHQTQIVIEDSVKNLLKNQGDLDQLVIKADTMSKSPNNCYKTQKIWLQQCTGETPKIKIITGLTILAGLMQQLKYNSYFQSVKDYPWRSKIESFQVFYQIDYTSQFQQFFKSKQIIDYSCFNFIREVLKHSQSIQSEYKYFNIQMSTLKMIAIYKISTLKLVATASNETEALQSTQKNQSVKVSAQVKSINLHPEERQRIQTDQGCWFCKTDDFDLMYDNLLTRYLVLTVNTYPERHAYALIQLIKDEFAKLGEYTTTPEANLKIHIKAPLKDLCTRYNDLAQVDKIFLAQEQVNQTQVVMEENVKKMLQNQGDLDQLAIKADTMNMKAQDFSKNAADLASIMYWRNMKLKIIIGLIVLAGLMYVLVPIIIQIQSKN